MKFQGRPYIRTWDTPRQAEAWLERTRQELSAGTYPGQEAVDPLTGRRIPQLGVYARAYIAARTLKPRTRREYTRLLRHFEPLATWHLDVVTRRDVTQWYAGLPQSPAERANAYRLLHAIFAAAVDEDLIAVTPVRIKGAGAPIRRVMPELPTPVQVQALAEAMPSEGLSVMVELAAWCGLRYGELAELRRKDLVLDDGGRPVAMRVRRAVTRIGGVPIVGTPKSRAGLRDVAIPPHLHATLAEHVTGLPEGAEELLFPGPRGGHMAPSTLHRTWHRVRALAGFSRLRWHDLRHFAGTMAAQAGATLAELMARLGHSTVAAAMIYQQAVSGRDTVIAEKLSNVVALRRRRPDRGAQVARS